MRTAPALLLLCAVAAAQPSVKFMGYPVTISDPGTDPKGYYPKGPATVCVEMQLQRQCYTPRERFGRSPKVEAVEFKSGMPALLFSADAGGVSGTSVHFA